MPAIFVSLSGDITAGEKYLAAADPVLGRLIESQGPVLYQSRGDYFYSLCRSIIGQQVSMAAARAIFNRFELATALKPQRISFFQLVHHN